MKLIVVNESKKHMASKELKKIVDETCGFLLGVRARNKAMLSEKKELTVVFLGEAEMQKINREFRKKNKPTDVLSFASADPDSLGELLLCLPVLRLQARRQGHSLREETRYMIIHGILHLLGYDHERSKKEEKVMFALQERCFEKTL